MASVEFCRWDVTHTATSIVMRTRHDFQGFQVELERTVALIHRTVRSTTHAKNTGRAFTPVRWFPHPFYPQPETDELCRFNAPVRLADSPGFAMAENGFITRKAWPWTDGYFLPVDHQAQANLVVSQRHPLLGLVSATCSYVPAFMPIWGNHTTFSWEPFFERTLGPGRVRAEASVRMNFDKVSETRELFDPDGQVTRSTQTVNSNSKTTEPKYAKGGVVQVPAIWPRQNEITPPAPSGARKTSLPVRRFARHPLRAEIHVRIIARCVFV